MPISDWSDCFPQTITHAAFNARDEYGKPSFDSGVSFDARIVFKQKLVRKKDGSEIMSRGSVWILGNPVITSEDQITFPDGSTPPILSYEQPSDEDGAHHVKVFFA